MMFGRVLRTGLSSLRDRAANLRRRLAALRFNPSRKVTAKPRHDFDRNAATARISKRFSKTLEYLARIG